jgi:hypothetical protein
MAVFCMFSEPFPRRLMTHPGYGHSNILRRANTAANRSNRFEMGYCKVPIVPAGRAHVAGERDKGVGVVEERRFGRLKDRSSLVHFAPPA